MAFGPSEHFDAPPSDAVPIRRDAVGGPLDEDADPVNLFQEINERRARIENAELLRRLRGL
ncbi:MAG TPA: hypothetical protein VLI41_09380 [Phenylobacterium sp.]|uniref:hypothetical protein n=1 Tax=Phenylobacterium sp. TaxID=1871053 RepID=UPI002C5E2C78|nr:hypothetical protein [Phenylobacterium sp.]HSV03405.1 hypothetical protein [Phenylobacterium sp.]